jgi:hypothetical protein
VPSRRAPAGTHAPPSAFNSSDAFSTARQRMLVAVLEARGEAQQSSTLLAAYGP